MLNFNARDWRYRNTFLLALSVIALLIFADHAIVRGIIEGISGLGYFGIFLTGIFIVSTFTIVPALLLLTTIAQTYGYWETVLLASAGAVFGDFLIFRFIRDTVSEELRPIFNTVREERHLKALFSSPFFIWMAPVVGAFFIASPLPDELGLSILGLSGMSNTRFLVLVSILDLVGIGLLVRVLQTL